MNFSFKFINNYLEEKSNMHRDMGAAMRDISLVSSDSTRSPADAVNLNPPSENVVERDLTDHNKLSLNDNIFEVQCLSSSRANVSKDERNSFLTRTGIRDYDFPELVVFVQEENHDIFVEKQVFSLGMCSVEKSELDKSISCTMNPDVECSTDSSEETEETLSSDSSDSSRCVVEHQSINYISKGPELGQMFSEHEKDMESGTDSSTSTGHSTVRTSQPRKLKSAFRSYLLTTPTEDSTNNTNSNTSKCNATIQVQLENKNRNPLDALISRIGCSNECLHCAVSLQPPEISTMQKSEIVESFKRSTDSSDSFEMEHEYDGGSTSYPNHPSDCAAKSGNVSHRSNSSIESAHSFAFPILLSEWSGSPVRMAETDRSQLRHEHRWWRKIFACCSFLVCRFPIQSCTYS